MIPTTKLSGTIREANGTPYAKPVTFRLNRTVRDPDHGTIVPHDHTVTPDVDGGFSIDLWPNARGIEASRYRLTIGDDVFTFELPDQAETNLVDVLTLPG
jgi:hypothetical protein